MSYQSDRVVGNNDLLRVAICIITYKRPELLRQCLKSLAKQKFKKYSQPNCRLVIIDNDISQPLVKVNGLLNAKLFSEVIHKQESKKGVSSARNHAIQAAGDVDFIAFIDDDEEATPYWLDELLFCQRQYQADVVTGPVLPNYLDSCPKWIHTGKFFEVKRYQTGLEVNHAGNGNVLIRTHWLKVIPGPYDVKMNPIGGEDTLFFTLIKGKGAKLIWSDEAIVSETVSSERMTIKWLLMRAIRFGSLVTLVEKRTDNPLKIIAIRIMKGTARILFGLLSLIPNSITKGLAGFVQSLENMATGLGEFLGIMGIIPQGYK